MAPTTHALLPEIAFLVAQYLELDDCIACSLVSKAFYAYFAPYLWEDVHFGLLSSGNRTKHLQVPFARWIVVERSPSRRERILQVLPRIAPWIRSLSIHYGFFDAQMLKFGNQCTNLHSLLMSSPLLNMHEYEIHRSTCEALVRGNVGLRSLTLIGWRDRSSNPLRQVWDPLYTCARQTNLSTLRIQHTRFYEQDLEPFWTICRQLEILELTDVRFTVLPDLLDESSPGMEPAPHATATAVTTTDAAAAVRFPRLRELTLEALQMAPSKQMKHFVLQCPLIHTLVWRPTSYEFLMGDFCDYFAANRWPHLDSLEISGQFNFISAEEYDRFLQSTSQLFRCLDLQTKTMEQGSFDLLRKGGHFKTLTKVDLSVWPPSRDEVNGVDVAASKRIREVLESCPSLEHIVGTSISGRDIIDSQPWVCHRLKMFAMLICMDITKQTPRAKAEYTEHDKRQCHQVLERLGQMKQLEVLNMSNYDLMIAPLRPPVILPLDLRMGLEHLSTLRDLEWLGVDGTLNMRLVDVEWMLQHWTKLRKMTGKPFTVRDSWFLRDNNVQVYLIMKALAARKVEVPEQWKAYEKQVKKHG